MRKALVAAVCALLWAASPAQASDRPCPADSPAAAGRVRQLDVASAALGATSRVCVLVPADYESSSARYPVLYLLHGAGDDQSSWLELTDVEEATASLPLIVVMPDGGRGTEAGWYSDWVSGPRWETYHIGELVPLVDATFRTLADRGHRAVAGLSMGGFGAMSYAARHPQLFVAAASFSGAVDTAGGGPGEAVAFEVLHDRFGTPDDRVWGDYVTDEVRWRAHNPTDLASNLRWTVLSVVTGSGVPAPGDSPTDSFAEAGVAAMNLSFHAALTRQGVAHDFTVTPFGTHAWRYWQEALHALLPRLMSVFDAPPPPPAAFDYRSAEPSFDAWGWSFVTDPRRAREFVELTGVSPSGMRVRGSGVLRVASPPLYQPGSPHTVTVTWSKVLGPGFFDARPQVADSAGRLHFDVDLGPAHTAQQYTPEARAAEASPDYWTDATVTVS